MVSWHQKLMAGSEPLIQEADPPITKLEVELEMAEKDGPPPKKKQKKPSSLFQLTQFQVE